MDENRPGSGKNFVQKDDFEVRQEALWRWAAERVPTWGKVQKDDYDFRSWMKKVHARNCSALVAFTSTRVSRTNFDVCSC